MAVSTGAIIEHLDVIVDLGIGDITSLVDSLLNLAPLNRSTLYVRVGSKGGLHATSSSYRRTDSRQTA